MDNERGLRILCLDGAGMRNIAQLPLLEAIESAAGNGKKIHEMFDFVSVTQYKFIFQKYSI